MNGKGGVVPYTEFGEQNNLRQPLIEDPLIAKFKRWLLVILTILIMGAAGILIAWRILLRF